MSKAFKELVKGDSLYIISEYGENMNEVSQKAFIAIIEKVEVNGNYVYVLYRVSLQDNIDEDGYNYSIREEMLNPDVSIQSTGDGTFCTNKRDAYKIIIDDLNCRINTIDNKIKKLEDKKKFFINRKKGPVADSFIDMK